MLIQGNSALMDQFGDVPTGDNVLLMFFALLYFILICCAELSFSWCGHGHEVRSTPELSLLFAIMYLIDTKRCTLHGRPVS